MAWATSVPILVFLDLSVLDLGPCTRQTDVSRRQTDRQHHHLMPPPRERGHNKPLIDCLFGHIVIDAIEFLMTME